MSLTAQDIRREFVSVCVEKFSENCQRYDGMITYLDGSTITYPMMIPDRLARDMMEMILDNPADRA